jgi:hypothetical protein
MIWKEIEGYNYEISNSGIVRNIKTKVEIKPAAGGTSPYLLVKFYLGKNKRKSFLLHRLLAKYFIPNPENKTQVNHIDKNKLNNDLSNLEWNTPKENMKHHYETGGIKFNNQVYKNKFGKDHNRSIKIECNGIIYNGYSEASRMTNIKITTIHNRVKNNIIIKGMHFQLAKL